MFRNKVVVRAETPLPPSTSPFLFLQIHLDLPRSPSSSSSPLTLKIESLCWKLSRTLRLACFHHSPGTLFLVYQRSQSSVAKEAVGVIKQKLPVENVEEEEELSSGSLAAKAVECGLKSLLLNEGWRCVGESCFVYSTFSSGEERRHLLALNVSVQSDIDGAFVFLVSPDVVRFSRFEVANLVCSKIWEKFDNGEEVVLEDCNFATSCSSLPSLFEGHVIGASKLHPAGENLLQFEEVWSIKHGLEVPSDYFIKIHFPCGGCTSTQWFPSTLVLQGAGFSPAPQSIRIAESVQVLQSFMRIIEAWDFFAQGKLKIKSISSLTIGSNLLTWTETANNCQSGMVSVNCCSSKGEAVDKLVSIKDYRSPRLASNRGTIGKIQESEIPDTNVTLSTTILQVSDICDSVSENLGTQASPLKQHAPAVKISHSETVEGIGTETAQQRKFKVNNDVQCKLTRKRMKSQSDLSDFTVKIVKDSKGNVEGGVPNRKCLSEIDMNCPREVEGNMRTRKRTSKKEEPVKIIMQKTACLKEEAVKIITRKRASPKEEPVNIITRKTASLKEEAAKIITQKTASPKEEFDKIITQKTASQKEEAVKIIMRKTASPKEDMVKIITRKRAFPKEEKSMDDVQKNMPKKTKPQSDPSDISVKVIDHHERRQLESLTVVELKCFLASKQAKVGGKKQDLIQRISALLSQG